MSDALITLNGWFIDVTSRAEQARADMLAELEAADYDGELPQGAVGQQIASDMVLAIGRSKAFRAEVERVSKELREPYFNHAKKIKATSDLFVAPVAEVEARISQRLAEFEAAKRRIEIELERRRQEEAAKAGVPVESITHYEAPKTEGVQVKVAYEYEVTDRRAFVEWCWRTGKAFINDITFFKRDVMEYINSQDVDRNIPGLRVYQAVGTTVKRAKGPRTLTVQSKVEL
jgi:hypothetical protein